MIVSEEDVKAMSANEYEQYCLMVIGALTINLETVINKTASQAILPNIAVMAALMEVMIKTLPENEPHRSDEIARCVRFFIDRTSLGEGGKPC